MRDIPRFLLPVFIDLEGLLPISHLVPLYQFRDAVLPALRVVPHADTHSSPLLESDEDSNVFFQRKRLLSLGIKKARFRASFLEETIRLGLVTNIGVHPAQILTIPVSVEPTVLTRDEFDSGFLRLIHRVAIDRPIHEYTFCPVQDNRI